MKTIEETIKERKKKPTKVTSERAELLETILALINQERIGTPYKPFTPPALGVKTSHLSTRDLYWFHQQCSVSKGSYSKCFFGRLKVK